jgi:hypothetical protein
MLSVRNIKGFILVPYSPKPSKYLLSYHLSTDLLARLSIISAASHSAAQPKIVELCNHTAHASFHHVCAEDGNLKRSHPPIIDGDKQVDWWLVVGWICSWRTADICQEMYLGES